MQKIELKEGATPFVQVARPLLQAAVETDRVVVSGVRYGHGVTLPNEIALRSFRTDISVDGKLVPKDPSAYVEASVNSARLVIGRRIEMLRDLPVVPRNRYLVSVLSPAWTSRRRELDRKKLLDSQAPPETIRIWHGQLRQDFHFARFELSGAKEAFSHPGVQAMLHSRQLEAQAYTASLAMQAAHDLTPVLRLEPRVNKIRNLLCDIGNCARGNGPHRRFKEQKLYKRIAKGMTESIDARYLELLCKPADRIEGMSCLTDLPLELLPVNGIPAALAFDCSRIPLTPGNVSFGLMTSSDTIELSHRTFENVLIVRSFISGDPIEGILEHAIRSFETTSPNMPNVTIADVTSPEEFIGAVNRHDGALMIFDGHGARDLEQETGSLLLAGKPFSPWEFRKELRLPPIVLLSACDTIPIDGSHGAAAIGLLNAGARSVLGTTLPISALVSSHFIARLLYRIADFMEQAALVHDGPLEWRGFLAGLVRMSHVTEILFDSMQRFGVSKAVYEEIQMLANMEINVRNSSWHTEVAARMAKLLPREALALAQGENPLDRFTDALKCVQLGRPESILIVGNRFDPLSVLRQQNKIGRGGP